MRITTDYLVIGAGATGLTFTDSLAAESDADVVLVDRNDAPGGHWVHAYPFVALHSPSAYYGVNSLALGADQVDTSGPNAGFYERATKSEVLDHFAEAVTRLEQAGRVRLLSGHEDLGVDGGVRQVRDLRTGDIVEIEVRRKLVDARYLESSVPATHRPSFEVADDASVVPIGALPAAADSARSYVVLGAGKTAVDACLWLLDQGVDPERIRWVRARDAWFHDRAQFQPLDQVVGIMEGLASDAEAGAGATDVDDFFARLEAAGRVLRIDPEVPATMYRGSMLSAHELTELRRIDDVVRMGRVRRIERNRTLLERGDLETGADVLHVDCTARGLNNAPALPIFAADRIVLQQVRHNSPPFNAALLGFVEAHRGDDVEKNRLCPPNAYASSAAEYPRLLAGTWRTEGVWLGEPDLAGWIAASRLNLLQAFPAHQHEPRAQEAVTRYLTHVGDAIARFEQMRAPVPGADSAAPVR
jgi:hypothetical protein